MHEMIKLSYYKLYLRIWKLYIVAHRVRGGDRGLLAAGAGLPPPVLTATELTFTANCSNTAARVQIKYFGIPAVLPYVLSSM